MNETTNQTFNSKENILEETYNVLTQAAPDGYVEIDCNKMFTKVNFAYCKIISYSEEELLKMKINDVDILETPEQTDQQIKKIIETGFARFETKHKRKDGKILDIEVSSAYSKKQNKIFSFFRDITLINKTEEERKIFKLVADKTSIDIYWITPEGYFLYTNEKAAKSLGYNKEDLIGKSVWDVDPDYIESFRQTQWERIKKEKILIFETHHKDKLGNIQNVQICSTYVNIENKEYEFAFAIDITEIKKLQDQLIHSEKLSAVGQLAAGIAHEFNNILAIISNNTQLLNYKEYQNSPDLLKSIEFAVNRGAGIVSNMMAFAKPLSPRKELTKIEDIIEDVLKIQKQQITLENIEIDRLYEHTEKILIDAGQFQQVFLNLIINARHAILPKGKGKITISARTQNNNIEIKVIDNGIGINNENLKNIFTPFFSTKGAHAQNNHGIKGTGLGLSVTHTIIKNHNATIRVESEKDKGATFIIELPLSDKQIEILKTESEKITDESDKKELNILIIDDEPVLLSTMTRLFKINNCTVKDSVSGFEGIKLAKENKFEVIFLDMLLPDISGENIFKEIRKFDTDVQIVFISGQIGLEVERLLSLGAYSFIQKPFDMEAVKKILNEIRKKK